MPNIVYKKRHHSRFLALQALYSDEFRARNNESLDSDNLKETLKNEKDEEIKAYSICLYNGVNSTKSELDKTLSLYLINRKIEEISIIELCILRLSIYSILYDDSLHPSIIIDEAVKLSQEFSSANNYKFINGVLDAFVKDRQKGNQN